MRKLILAAVLVLMASGAQASSYLEIGGTVVDPIQSIEGGNVTYSGPNLEPGADLTGAVLPFAALSNADLTGAILPGANLIGAYMFSSTLSLADLSNANLKGVDLTNAILTNLTGAALYDLNTNFTGTGFDPVAAGWNLVPEPNTALLVGIGLVGMAARRRPATAR